MAKVQSEVKESNAISLCSSHLISYHIISFTGLFGLFTCAHDIVIAKAMPDKPAVMAMLEEANKQFDDGTSHTSYIIS
jgi:hypothetical protein